MSSHVVDPVTDALEGDTHVETSAAYGLNVLIVD